MSVSGRFLRHHVGECVAGRTLVLIGLQAAQLGFEQLLVQARGLLEFLSLLFLLRRRLIEGREFGIEIVEQFFGFSRLRDRRCCDFLGLLYRWQCG
jgi:hypothetical protein